MSTEPMKLSPIEIAEEIMDLFRDLVNKYVQVHSIPTKFEYKIREEIRYFVKNNPNIFKGV